MSQLNRKERPGWLPAGRQPWGGTELWVTGLSHTLGKVVLLVGGNKLARGAFPAQVATTSGGYQAPIPCGQDPEARNCLGRWPLQGAGSRSGHSTSTWREFVCAARSLTVLSFFSLFTGTAESKQAVRTKRVLYRQTWGWRGWRVCAWCCLLASALAGLVPGSTARIFTFFVVYFCPDDLHLFVFFLCIIVL